MCYSEDTMEIKNIPLSQIRRPLPRQTDPEKVNQEATSNSQLLHEKCGQGRCDQTL